MFKRLGMCAALVGATSPAYAGGGIGYSSTDAAGTIERVVGQRDLPDERVGAMVSYTRKDGSRSFVEYAIACEPLAFAYLGITTGTVERTPNLRTVRVMSDALLGNTVRPVNMIALGQDTSETSVRAIAQAVCS